MTTKQRIDAKREAKSVIGNSYFLLPIGAYAIVYFILNVLYYNNEMSLLSWIASIVAAFMGIGAMYTAFNVIHKIKVIKVENNFKDFNEIFENSLWLKLLAITFIKGLFTVLWMLLFIIPGIIKCYSYSQAEIIYYNAYRNGQQMTFLEAITQSRELMDNQKFNLFWLDLTFIGWNMLSIITLGLAEIYVAPYYAYVRVKFFDNLMPESVDNLNQSNKPTDQPTTNQTTN